MVSQKTDEARRNMQNWQKTIENIFKAADKHLKNGNMRLVAFDLSKEDLIEFSELLTEVILNECDAFYCNLYRKLNDELKLL